MRKVDRDYLPAIFYGLGWDEKSQSACAILRAGQPENELKFPLNSLEAGELLNLLDHIPKGEGIFTLVTSLFLTNNYVPQGIFIKTKTPSQATMVTNHLEVSQKWNLHLAESLALSLRMSIPLFIHKSLYTHGALPLGKGRGPDVLC